MIPLRFTYMSGVKDAAIETKKLTKVFIKKKVFSFFKKREAPEKIPAVNDVTLRIEPGEIFGVLGPNGAGKTTFIKCLSTLLIPDSGEARVFGMDVVSQSQNVRKRIGLVTGGERSMYWKLTARENLFYFASLYAIPKPAAQKRIEELLSVMELQSFADMRLEKYSTGMRQKVSLARSLLHEPDILILDEPTLGLDPSFSRSLRDFIKRDLNEKQKKTILLTTHYMDEADELCRRIALMKNGSVIAVDTPSGLKKRLREGKVVEVRFSGTLTEQELLHVPGMQEASIFPENGFMVAHLTHEQPEQLFSSFASTFSQKLQIFSIAFVDPTLEDAFIALTRDEIRS